LISDPVEYSHFTFRGWPKSAATSQVQGMARDVSSGQIAKSSERAILVCTCLKCGHDAQRGRLLAMQGSDQRPSNTRTTVPTPTPRLAAILRTPGRSFLLRARRIHTLRLEIDDVGHHRCFPGQGRSSSGSSARRHSALCCSRTGLSGAPRNTIDLTRFSGAKHPSSHGLGPSVAWSQSMRRRYAQSTLFHPSSSRVGHSQATRGAACATKGGLAPLERGCLTDSEASQKKYPPRTCWRGLRISKPQESGKFFIGK
jgi:hypothetical protein